MNCKTCGQGMLYKEGISKAGKPYRLYKCEHCDIVEFIKDSAPKVNAPAPTNGVANMSLRSQIMAYAKDIVVAKIAAGTLKEHEYQTTADGFKLLLRSVYEPYGKVEVVPEYAPKPVVTSNPKVEYKKFPSPKFPEDDMVGGDGQTTDIPF